MSYISPIATDSNGNQKTAESMQTLGKDDFLQLLVTKMQYQDPLNPMDDEDFIAQLAQFSSLEQMNNIATGLDEANQLSFLQMQSLNNTMAAGMIGKDIKAEYDGVYVDKGNSSTISFTLDQAAKNVEFTIRDTDGTVVAVLNEEDLVSGANAITWDGKDRSGNQVADGYYTVQATATAASGATFTPSLALAGRVESVVYRDGIAFLKVQGIEIPISDVIAVGESGAFTGTDEGDGGEDEG
jgi:flagellar basal-body rod modification protein FlgD